MNETDQAGLPVAGPLEAPVGRHYVAKVTTWTDETPNMLPVEWRRCVVLYAGSIDQAWELANLFAGGSPSFGRKVTGAEVREVAQIQLPYEITQAMAPNVKLRGQPLDDATN